MKHLLFVATLCWAPVHAEDENERARLVFLEKVKSEVHEVLDVADAGGKTAKALDAYKKHAGRLTVEGMAEIYKNAGRGAEAFKSVAFLIETNKITDAHSIEMAGLRETMIEGLINEIGQEKGWRIARSDSGNVTSGMKSDLDQTFYVFEAEHVDGEWKFEWNPDRDGEFIREFERRWREKYDKMGLSLEALDIASIEGKNRFPDIRVTDVQGFWQMNRRTHVELRNTPGAYTYGGAVGHQMQFRALASILKKNPRAFRLYGPAGDEKESDWERKELRSVDTPEGRQRLQDWTDEAIKTMFGKAPEMRPVWAFDAALANYLELQHYMYDEKFQTKYHLRTFEDSILSQWLADKGLGRKEKFELVDIGLNKRQRIYDAILPRVYPGDTPDAVRQRALHRLALEVSVAQRLHHKGPKAFHKIAAFRGKPPSDPAAQRRLIFEEFGRAMYGDDWKATPKQMDGAKWKFRELASEFCLESAFRTSKEAFAVLLGEDGKKHFDIDRYRSLLDIESDVEWERTKANLESAAHLTFLYGIYDLGTKKSIALMNRIRTEFGNRHVPRLLGLWVRGQAGLTESTWRGIFGEIMLEKVPDLGNRVQQHVLRELGWERLPVAEKVNAELIKHKLVWSPKAFAHNMAYDPGNIDALAQIVRTYFESKGDMDAVFRTVADEFLMAVPVLGQMVGASRGGVEGLVAMGIAMYHPPFGGVLIAVSLGRTGIAIYDIESERPKTENAVNAVYRGFSGPELRFVERAPAQFTKADGAKLTRLQAELAAARPVGVSRSFDPQELERRLDESKRAWSAYRQLDARLTPQIEGLKLKRTLWTSYRDDPAYGGFFTESGAQKLQRPFENHLLAAIEPVISFSRTGIVDFNARQDSAELERLARRMKQATGKEAAIAAAAHAEAQHVWDHQQRAARFYSRALGRSRPFDGLDSSERRMGLPELRFKLKRDSLYPALRKLGYDDPDAFVDAFFRRNFQVIDELTRQGLLESTEIEWVPAFPRPVPRAKPPTKFPAHYMAQLKKRVRADYKRSKILWDEYQKREKARRMRNEQVLYRRVKRYDAAEAGGTVSRLLHDEKTKLLPALYDALREGIQPPTVPTLTATVYYGNKDSALGPAGYACRFQLTADPFFFKPPYSSDLQGLNADDVRQAIASAQSHGQPLFATTVAALRSALAQNPAPPRGQKDERTFFLVHVYCGEVDARTVIGVPRVGNRSLIGQSVAFGRKRADKIVETPPPTVDNKVWYISAPGIVDADRDRAYRRAYAKFPDAKQKPADTYRAKPIATALYLSSVRPAYLSYAKTFRKLQRGAYYGPCHFKVTCGGQTRFAFVVFEPFSSRTYGSLLFSGLKDGTHRVQVEARLADGTRVSDAFSIAVKLKPIDLSRDERSLTSNRRRYAEQPTPRHAGFFVSAIERYIENLIKSGAPPKAVDTLLDEYAKYWEGGVRYGYSTSNKSGLRWNLTRLTVMTRVARAVGSTTAYNVLRKVAETYQARMPTDNKRYEIWSAHKTLGDIKISNAGSIRAGRAHYAQAHQLEKAAGRSPKPLAETWPKTDFGKLAEKGR